MFKMLLVTPFFLASCQTTLRPEIDDDELLHLKPLQTQTFKKNADESWNNETRLAYAGYYYLLGEYLSLEHNSSEAESFLELANELDPNEFLAFKAIVAKITSGKEEEVQNELQRLTILYPKSARFHALYGAFLVKLNHFDLAVDQFEKAILLEPEDEKPYLQIIAIYQQQNDLKKANKVTRRLNAAAPRSAQAKLLYAHMLQDEGRGPEALKSARQAFELSPSNAESTLFYARLLEQSGDKATAIELYDQLFDENPSLEELIGKTLALYRTYGNLEEIYKRLSIMGAHSKNKSIGIEIQKALILWELSKNQEALNVLLQLQDAYPDSEQVLYLTGLAYEKLNDFNGAISLYNRVTEDSSFYLPANYQSLRMMESQKRFDDAYKILRKISQSRYVISEVYILGANFFAKDKKFEEAIQFLEEGSRKFPDQVDLVFLKGVFQEKMGRFEECIQSMRYVIRKDPNNSPALNYLGYIWAERGMKLDLSQSLIERALSLKPNDGFYLDSLAWVFYQRGDLEKALETLLAAIRSEPNEGVIVEHLGDIYLKLNRREEAEKAFEDALKKSSLEQRDRERLENKLQQLQSKKEV